MGEIKTSNKKERTKIIYKIKKKLFSDKSEEKQSKNNKKENPKKSRIKKREKEKIIIDNKEVFENNAYIDEKNQQSKDILNFNTYNNKKNIMYKSIKLQKIDEKKIGSENKKKYIYIFIYIRIFYPKNFKK